MNSKGAFSKFALLVCAAGLITAQSGMADTINFSAILNGAQDKVNTPWTGNATATLNTTTDLFSWNVSYNVADTAGGTPDMAHWHYGAPGVDGPIQITLADTSMTNPLQAIPTQFVGSQTVTSTQASQIEAGDWYVNVHTNVYPAGIIRGQLSAVPEPASLWMLGGGLSLLGLAAQWRRRRA